MQLLLVEALEEKWHRMGLLLRQGDPQHPGVRAVLPLAAQQPCTEVRRCGRQDVPLPLPVALLGSSLLVRVAGLSM
jgi:hypothetical protein